MAIGAGAAGAWAATNATTHTVTLPAHATGDMLIVIAACKAATITSVNQAVTTPATGWARAAAFADGTTNAGNGTGSVNQAIFYKVATSGAETNPIITWGGSQTAAPGIAVGLSFTKGASDFWSVPTVLQAATTNATSISVTMGSNPGITAGDWGVIAHTTRDDSALTVPTWTATGTTLAAVVEYPATAIASGTSNDMAGDAAYRSVTSGEASAAPVVTGTQAVGETGVTCFIVLRARTSADYGLTVAGLSPVGYWRLGEAGGATIATAVIGPDLAYNGTPTLAATGLVSGSADTAVDFSSEGQVVGTCPAGSSTGATLTAWINWSGASMVAGNQLFLWGTTSGPYHAVNFIEFNGGTQAYAQFDFNDGSPRVVESTETMWSFSSVSQTHFYAFVHDYAAELVSIYFDGVLWWSEDVSAFSPPSAIPAGGTMEIGGSTSTSGMEAVVDEPALFARVLSPAEILSLYVAGAPPSNPPPSKQMLQLLAH